jgi:hypothetical protein
MKSNIVLVIVLSTIFGILSGMTGFFFAKDYFSGTASMWGDYNLKDYSQNTPIVISGAKKIVIEQEDRINQIISSSNNGLIGVFKKKNIKTDNVGEVNNYYFPSDILAQGVVLTNDGWLLVSEFDDLEKFNNYVVITNNKEIYEIDKVVNSKQAGFSYIHVKKSNNFNTFKFAEKNRTSFFRNILVIDWLGNSMLESITKPKNAIDAIKSSDKYSEEYLINSPVDSEFFGAPVFDWENNLIGVVKTDGKMLSISSFKNEIVNILNNRPIVSLSLGVNYLSLSGIVNMEKNNTNGALIVKDGAKPAVIKKSIAENSGLREGDIIISINNIEIDKENDLAEVISGIAAGEKIKMVYQRNGQKIEKDIILDVIK